MIEGYIGICFKIKTNKSTIKFHMKPSNACCPCEYSFWQIFNNILILRKFRSNAELGDLSKEVRFYKEQKSMNYILFTLYIRIKHPEFFRFPKECNMILSSP